MCLALRASGLWLRYATLQNLIPSFPWIAPPRPPPCAPHALHPCAIQGKEGIKFCHLATLLVPTLSYLYAAVPDPRPGGGGVDREEDGERVPRQLVGQLQVARPLLRLFNEIVN